mmetsp:Transcript_33403/g.78146  ORF Transcript_33403/g.78146 Transcript_33403/m.78146 type:complete len:308 (-) Transcript_33403:817-1740(-)
MTRGMLLCQPESKSMGVRSERAGASRKKPTGGHIRESLVAHEDVCIKVKDAFAVFGVARDVHSCRRGRNQHGEPDDAAEHQHDDTGPPSPLDESLDDTLPRLPARCAYAPEPERVLPAELLHSEVLHGAREGCEEDHEARGGSAHLRLEVERHKEGAQDHPASDAKQPGRNAGCNGCRSEQPDCVVGPLDVAVDELEAELDLAVITRNVLPRTHEDDCSEHQHRRPIERPVRRVAIVEVVDKDFVHQERVDNEESGHQAQRDVRHDRVLHRVFGIHALQLRRALTMFGLHLCVRHLGLGASVLHRGA